MDSIVCASAAGAVSAKIQPGRREQQLRNIIYSHSCTHSVLRESFGCNHFFVLFFDFLSFYLSISIPPVSTF